MNSKTAILVPDSFYHVYNRANGNEKLFLNEENYHYFIKRYNHYIRPIAELFAFCLIPNHYHFLIRIRAEEVIIQHLEKWLRSSSSQSKTLQGFGTLEGLARSEIISSFLTQQFSHLQNAYSQAFNKQQRRKGSLFMHPYKRKVISESSYFIHLVHYIHLNPVEAGLVSRPNEWPYSSFRPILNGDVTFIESQQVMEWFEGIDNFLYVHSKRSKLILTE